MRIAIDGPAGAGKSTIARKLAQRLGYTYIDTGAMYRALTYLVLNHGLEPDNEEKVCSLVEDAELEIAPDPKGSGNLIYLNGKNITHEIRKPIINEWVSKISSYQRVRELMVRMQQKIAAKGFVVMDGRDIGTTVIPDAELKIFLKASAEERARRRSLEIIRQGYDVDLSELCEQIKKRDLLDSTRSVSPLRKASDAIEIDTTNLSINEVIEKVLALLHRRELHV